MNIQNLSCRYLKINSPLLQSTIDLQQLSRINITSTFNDGETITETIDASALTSTWSVIVEFNVGMTIQNLNIKNVYTNAVFTLLTQEYPITAQGLIDMKAEISVKLETDYNITTAVQTSSIVNNLLTYSISNLPESMIMSTMILDSSGSEVTEYFTCVESEKYIVTTDSILLTPTFFGLSEFENAIVHVKLEIVTTVTTISWDETCFFMDCTMKQNLLDNISTEQCNEADVHILMLHYGLTQASNYNCDCDKMYEIFEYLNNNIQITNRNPCGC